MGMKDNTDTRTDPRFKSAMMYASITRGLKNEASAGDGPATTEDESEASQPWSVYVSEEMEQEGIREVPLPIILLGMRLIFISDLVRSKGI